MKKFVVEVTQIIEVQLDEDKFDNDFIKEFVYCFYPYDTLEEHACHLAQLHARGICDNGSFIEGYGPACEMGIKFRGIDQYEEIS